MEHKTLNFALSSSTFKSQKHISSAALKDSCKSDPILTLWSFSIYFRSQDHPICPLDPFIQHSNFPCRPKYTPASSSADIFTFSRSHQSVSVFTSPNSVTFPWRFGSDMEPGSDNWRLVGHLECPIPGGLATTCTSIFVFSLSEVKIMSLKPHWITTFKCKIQCDFLCTVPLFSWILHLLSDSGWLIQLLSEKVND